MILVKAICNFTFPHGSTSKLVIIATFIHQDIARMKAIAFNLG
ncbi:hypothetical protein Q671_12975 [Halomonas sp. PBN3]|nr:hypothetical protein Q671_12975 [Halomonas sp. PBN3]